MIKFIKDITLTILFTLILYIFLTNSKLIIYSVNNGINVFKKNVLPSILPFFILTDILLKFNYFNNLKKIIKLKYINFFIVSIISGLPSNAKYISDMLKDNRITLKDASILLGMSFFPNPMFVLGTTCTLFNSRKPIIILLIIYLSTLLVYIINYKCLDNNDLIESQNKVKLFSLLKTSITNSFNSLIVILGIIIIFSILTNIIKYYFNLNSVILSIISSVLELTTGVKSISIQSIPEVYKYTLLSFALSSSGLSVNMQALGILSNYKINYKYYIKNKLLVIILSTILTIIVFKNI